jgi:hypothetical protein
MELYLDVLTSVASGYKRTVVEEQQSAASANTPNGSICLNIGNCAVLAPTIVVQ